MAKLLSVEQLKDSPEADLIVNKICDRKKKGLYTLTLIAGLPGSGKSSQCCRLGELVLEKLTGENTFTERNIVDSFLKFIKLVREAKPEEVCVISIEEISVLFPSRRAMSGENVDIAKVLDTCRKKQIIIFANAPLWTSIDSHIRSMGNIYIQTLKVYKKAQIVFSKCYILQTDPRTGKTYTHNFKRGNKDVNRMYTNPCKKETWEKYEKGKDEFLEVVYKKAEARALDRQKKDDKLLQHVTPKVAQGLKPKEVMVLDYVKVKGLTHQEAADKMNLSRSRVTRMLLDIAKKSKNIEYQN